MGKTSEKLAYLNETKRLMRRRINSLGGSITLETKFREYLDWLNGLYKAASAPVDFEILGETTQKAVNTSANLLYIPDDEIVTDGVTVTISNGKITINGTPTRDLYIKITNGMEVEYTNPAPNAHHKWYKEKLYEFDEPTSIYYQLGLGGGTKAGVGNALQLGYHYNNSNTEASTNQYITDFINVYPEMKIISSINKTNVIELNFVDLYLKSGESFNTYGYIQVATSSESYWVPNNDAAPPSPDNPKTIINKTGNIIYTASDGTEFPVSLGDIELCGTSNPNGKPDRIYCKNGKFWLEKRIGSVILTGDSSEHWNNYISDSVYGGQMPDGDYEFYQFGSNYSVSNYFKCVVNSNITDSTTAGNELNNGELITIEEDNNIWLKYTDLVEEDPYSTSQALKNWLSTHNTIIQLEIPEDDVEPEEITQEDYPTLYGQLQAIVDYKTGIEIEEKLGG